MPVSVGDIYFTANFTDGDPDYSESFSFVATTDIDPGEVITFHSPESATGVGDTSFTFTVGANGLSALDRVTIGENSGAPTDVMTLIEDPSNGSVSAVSGNGWSISDNDNIIAAQGGQVLAAIVNSSNNGSSWDANIGVTGLSTTQLDAFLISNPTLSPIAEHVGGLDGNVMFSGTNITTQGSDPAFWESTDTTPDHDNPNINGTTYATQDANITCFAAGTMIATPSGECTVETLEPGASILSAAGDPVEVKWIGRQTVSTRFGPAERLMPVRFAAGSLGDGLPHTDLTVTADHGMLVGGVICHAGALVNGTTITRVPLAEMGETYTVYHIETEAHEIILANGAPAETFIDNVSRRVFDNFAEFEALYGDVPEMEELDYPRAMSARQVPGRIQQSLAGKQVA
jgi:hypothetical protein